MLMWAMRFVSVEAGVMGSLVGENADGRQTCSIGNKRKVIKSRGMEKQRPLIRTEN